MKTCDFHVFVGRVVFVCVPCVPCVVCGWLAAWRYLSPATTLPPPSPRKSRIDLHTHAQGSNQQTNKLTNEKGTKRNAKVGRAHQQAQQQGRQLHSIAPGRYCTAPR